VQTSDKQEPALSGLTRKPQQLKIRMPRSPSPSLRAIKKASQNKHDPISAYRTAELCATICVTGKLEKNLSFKAISVLPSSNPSGSSWENGRGCEVG
jgi:hypothetical protein